MSEAYLTNWSFEGETPATRNHFHATALHEARIAYDHRQGIDPHEAEPARPATGSILTRLRLAFAGRPSSDACNCPA